MHRNRAVADKVNAAVVGCHLSRRESLMVVLFVQSFRHFGFRPLIYLLGVECEFPVGGLLVGNCERFAPHVFILTSKHVCLELCYSFACRRRDVEVDLIFISLFVCDYWVSLVLLRPIN